MQKFWRFFSRSLLWSIPTFFLSGCVSSKAALEGAGGRTSYNTILQMTNSEQMLLNLIRLRYYDAPFFLDVTTITTQYTFKGSASSTLPIPGFSKANPFLLGGELSWADQPTIQYAPLEGQDFAKQLLTPIDLRTIQQLILSGWDIELVLRLVVQGFNDYLNYPEASEAVPDFEERYQKFFEVARLLRNFQRRSELKVGVRKLCKKKDPIEEENAEDSKQILQIAFPKGSQDAEKLAQFFPENQVINDHYVANIELGFTSKGKIGVIPRSVLSCMYYLSLGIEVPENDISMGKACTTKGIGGEIFDWQDVLHELITIHSSKYYPANAYVVTKYKDCWFYIDDCDFHSKKTFLLLLQLYNLKSQEPKTLPPLLTLPLG